ncbi:MULTISPECIES: hypothetical protein [Eubacteriales]|uniref:hypothetical protein n=1 Tax=Eubacteriales TaxID=186802 RepID=UPI0013705F6F|nr:MULTISPECIES: hypothetical protein [Eubacteriales]
MIELIEQYLNQFNENFPLYALMGVEEAEIEAIIQDCLDKGTPYRPPEMDEKNLY